MKKFKILLSWLVVFMLISNFTVVSANENSTIVSNTVEVLENGDYIETIITEQESAVSVWNISKSKTGSKTVNYKDSNGSILWSVTVNGTFLYDEVTSTCTKSTVSAYSNHTDWKIASSSADRSGATATATAVAKKYALGVAIQTVTKTVSLTCSKNGTLS